MFEMQQLANVPYISHSAPAGHRQTVSHGTLSLALSRPLTEGEAVSPFCYSHYSLLYYNSWVWRQSYTVDGTEHGLLQGTLVY